MSPAPTRPSAPLKWQRVSPYAIRAEGLPYGVSVALLPQGQRYTAWYGPLLREQPPGGVRPAQMIGIYLSGDEAKAACEAHRHDPGG
jgi:hypothetical protein